MQPSKYTSPCARRTILAHLPMTDVFCAAGRTLTPSASPRSLSPRIFWQAVWGAMWLRAWLVLPPSNWSVSMRKGMAREALWQTWVSAGCLRREVQVTVYIPPRSRPGDRILSLLCCSVGLVWKCSPGMGAADPVEGGSFAPSCLAPAPCPDKDWLHRCSLLARPLWHRLCPAVPVSRGYPLPSPDGRVRLSSGIHQLRLWEK